MGWFALTVPTNEMPTAMRGASSTSGAKLLASSPYLVADIGGSTTRVASATGAGVISAVEVSTIADGAADPLELLVKVRSQLRDCKYGAIAVAGRVDTDEIRLTNRDWHFSIPELQKRLHLQKLIVVNDFVAMAHAISALTPAELRVVRQGNADPGAPRLVCGPGTGFGLAVVYGRRHVIPTEAGHLRLGGIDQAEAKLLEQLSQGCPESLIVEDIISGKGICAVHRARTGSDLSSKKIIEGGHAGDAAALDTIHTFLRIFGRIVANLSLLFDARGGVFIGGGLGASLADFYSSSHFTRWFENHPTNEKVLREIPVSVVTHAVPGLVGAIQIMKNELRPERQEQVQP